MIQIIQTFFTGVIMVAAILAVGVAFNIGQKQNEINSQALKLQDFAEVFFMDQRITDETTKETLGWNLLVKNVSSYPVYINRYTINGTKEEVGSSVIPNNIDSWYRIPIPKDATEFSVSIEFEDYRGIKYKTEGNGVFKGSGWSIHSTRRVELI